MTTELKAEAEAQAEKGIITVDREHYKRLVGLAAKLAVIASSEAAKYSEFVKKAMREGQTDHSRIFVQQRDAANMVAAEAAAEVNASAIDINELTGEHE